MRHHQKTFKPRIHPQAGPIKCCKECPDCQWNGVHHGTNWSRCRDPRMDKARIDIYSEHRGFNDACPLEEAE